MAERFVRNGEIWKACTKCHEEKPHNEEHYYRSGKRSDGSTEYYSACKSCAARSKRVVETENTKERHKRRLRARQRAWVKLGQRHRKEFKMLYDEEMVREYLEHGSIQEVSS